jgi:hypothetical protein
MTTPTVVLVERFIAAGEQTLSCGHRIAKGDTLVDLRFGGDITSRAVSVCESCFDGIGRLGAPR